jgi:beta-lactam-binding protein with PASTA domain
MKYRVMAAGAAAIVTSALVAAPVAGAQTTTWEMPDIEGANLAAAVASFESATEGSGLKLNMVNRAGPSEVINLTNWTVCAQSPAAGSTLTAKSRPAVGVNRPTECG